MLAGQRLRLRSVYVFECWRANGTLRWFETVPNLVVNQGLDDALDKYFKGSAYTAAWYVGLVDNAGFGAFAAGDTAAKITTSTPSPPTTNDWAEATPYSNSTRPTLTLGTVSGQSVDNSAAKAVFNVNAAKTIKGGFVISNSTKGGTSGILYGAAAFGTARSVDNGDTLNVTVTLSAASA